MKWTQDKIDAIESDENRAKVIQVIEKYGDNKWWESDDPVCIAQYQLFEDPLMVDDFSIFHEGVEKLLDRPVWTHEFGINADGLRAEARIAIHRREVGSEYASYYLLEPTDERVDKIVLVNMRRKLGNINWSEVSDEDVRDTYNLVHGHDFICERAPKIEG